MNFRLFKPAVGDTLVCKTDYTYFTSPYAKYYKKGKSYEVILHGININTNEIIFIRIKNEKNTYLDFYDNDLDKYFYNQQELRKLKLLKLNGCK